MKSTTTSAPASDQGLGRRRHLEVRVDVGHATQVDARVQRVDRGDELELGSASTASHTVLPMRPAAPKTPTLVMASP